MSQEVTLEKVRLAQGRATKGQQKATGTPCDACFGVT